MSDDRKPGLMFWTSVMALVLLVAYPLSFGPACWITSRLNAGASAIPIVYRPLTWVMSPGANTMVNRVTTWYAKIGAPDDWQWGAMVDERGTHIGWMWGSTSPVAVDFLPDEVRSRETSASPSGTP
jgi:hypothetical protein